MKINKNTFFYSAAILAFSNLGLQALGFVYRIFLSRLASAEGLGVYRLVFAVYTVVNSVCLSGACMAISKLSAEEQNSRNIKNLINISIKLFLAIFAICSFVIVFFDEFIAENILGDIRTAPALIMMLVCLFLTGFENIFKSLFVGTGRVQHMAFSEISEQIIRTVAVLTLLYTFAQGDLSKIALLIMLGMTISEVFSVCYLTYIYRREFKQKALKNGDNIFLSRILKIAIPVSIAAFSGNILTSASSVILPARLMVSGFTNSEALSELGIISGMAMPLIMLPLALVGSVSTVLMPVVSKHSASKNYNILSQKINKALRVTGMIGIPATAAIVPIAIPLGRVLFNIQFKPVYIWMLAVFCIILYYHIMTSSALNGMGEQKKTMMTMMLAEGVQLVLTFFLAAIPSLNIYGYIIAMIISETLALFLNIIFLKRLTKKNVDYFNVFFIPIFISAAIYAWVSLIYNYSLGVFGAQHISVYVATVSSVFIYIFMLKLFGINIFRYLKQLRAPNEGSFMFF